MPGKVAYSDIPENLAVWIYSMVHGTTSVR